MNSISRRSLLQTAGVAGLGLATTGLLAACSTGSATPGKTSGPAQLRFWTHDPSYTKTFKAAIADKSLTGKLPFKYSLAVTQAEAGAVLTREISQKSANGTTADLIGVVIDQFPRVMKSNLAADLFEDLTSLTKPLGSKLLKTSPYSVDGKVYALESDLSLTVMYFREDVFEKNKISTDIKTWDEWIDAGAELNAKTGQFLGMHSNGDNGSMWNDFQQILLQRGGSPFNAKGELTLDTQEALDAMTFVQNSVKKKAMVVLSDPYGSATAGALKSSKLVATFMPNWYNVYGLQSNVPDQKGRWKMRTLPLFSQGGHSTSTLGGTGFAVGKGNQLSTAALDLLKATYLTNDGQFLRYQQGGYLPTLSNMYTDSRLLDLEDAYLGQKAFQTYAKVASDAPVYYQNANLTTLTTVGGAQIVNVLKGSTTAEQAIANIVKNFKAQVQS